MNAPIDLFRGPGAGFEEPFAMLLACHERVQRMLTLLQRLAEHLPTHGADDQARRAAHDIKRYFDQAGPAHHEDEERHIFPALLKQAGAPLKPLVRQLKSEHLIMARQWRAVRADLIAIEAGQGRLEAPAVQRWLAFAALYRSHIEAEEGQAYAAARALLDADAQGAMGQEMATRRGLKPG